MITNAKYLTEKQITQFVSSFFDELSNESPHSAWDVNVQVLHFIYGDPLDDQIKVCVRIEPSHFRSNAPIRAYLATVRDSLEGKAQARQFRSLDAAFNTAPDLVSRLRELGQDTPRLHLVLPYAGHVDYRRQVI